MTKRFFFTALAAGLLPALSCLQAQVVQYDITDMDGHELPAKITFLQPDERTPTSLDIKSRLPEYAARKNVVYTLYGKGEIPVTVGSLRAWVSRGPEWSIAVVDLQMTAERPAALKAVLERVVDTRGWISGDLHLHTKTYSGHGDANVEERLITLCAENVEWVVATDHNHHTDYAPIAGRIGAARWLATTVGNEVSTGIGHFNTFPLDPNSKPVDPKGTDARALFKRIRENPLDEILQVNHPRWTTHSGAYFNSFRLSPVTGEPGKGEFSWDFDSMEILNDNTLGGWEVKPLAGGMEPDFDRSVRDDWFNLLQKGLTYTAVGNSDSHDVNAMIGGCPRNFIASPTDDPREVREADLVKALREHRVTVSSGIFVTLTANGKPVGSTVRPEGGEVALAVKVQAAPWIDADRVVVVANGETVFQEDLPQPEKAPGGSLPPVRPVVRFEKTLRFKPAEDTWYVVYAVGDTPPYPMLPKVTIPLGFTNPVWVDADGDGRFTSARELAAALVRPDPGTKALRKGQVAQRIADRTPAFKRQVLGALAAADLQDREEPLADLLADPDRGVREGAAAALGALGGPRALAVLKEALAAAREPGDRTSLGRHLVLAGEYSSLEEVLKVYAAAKDAELLRMRADLKELCKKSPMDRWWTIGPFAAESVDAGLSAVHPPEKGAIYTAKYAGAGGQEVAWKRISASGGDQVSFTALKPAEKALAYAQVKVHAERPVKTWLLLGAKCGLEIRLDGKTIHRQASAAHRSAATQAVPVEFPAGTSALLVKAVALKGDFGFSLMAVDPLGRLRFEAPRLPESAKKASAWGKRKASGAARRF